MDIFEDCWKKNYGDTAPLGHALRPKLARHWLRFYDLPHTETKSYTGLRKDYDTVLHRANTLANEMFSPNETIWLVNTQSNPYPSDHNTAPYNYTIKNRKLEPMFNGKAVMDLGWYNYDDIYTTYAKQIPWVTHTLDDIFIEIATNDETDILLMNRNMTSILAPYGGGFEHSGGYDLFCETREKCAKIALKYEDWLSPRIDGL